MSLIPPSGFNVLQRSAEIHLAAFEALTFVLKASVPAISSSAINCIRDVDNSAGPLSTDVPVLDSPVLKFLNHINGFLAGRQLARTRRAVLMNWKVLICALPVVLVSLIALGCLLLTCMCNRTLKYQWNSDGAI